MYAPTASELVGGPARQTRLHRVERAITRGPGRVNVESTRSDGLGRRPCNRRILAETTGRVRVMPVRLVVSTERVAERRVVAA